MLTRSIVISLLYIITNNCLGQQTWLKTYGGTINENSRAITSTTDGGCIVLGFTSSKDGDFIDLNANSGYDGNTVVFKIDKNGIIQWKKTFGNQIGEGLAIASTIDGGCVFTGYTIDSLTSSVGSIFVVKLTSNGDTQWIKIYPSSLGQNFGLAIKENIKKEYFVTGQTIENDSTQIRDNRNIHLYKIDSDGELIWKKIFGGSQDDSGTDILPTNEGGCVIVGYSYSYDGDFYNNTNKQWGAFLISVDNNGNKKKCFKIGENIGGINHLIASTQSGDYIVVGSTANDYFGKTKGKFDIYISRIDTNGVFVWKKNVGGTNFEAVYQLQQTGDNNYAISGRTFSNDIDFIGLNKGIDDAFALSFDSQGKILWLNTFGGRNIDHSTSITNNLEGGVYILGDTRSNDLDMLEKLKGDQDIFVVKTDSKGRIHNTTQISENRDVNSLIMYSQSNIENKFITIKLMSPSKYNIEIVDSFGRIVKVIYDKMFIEEEVIIELGSLQLSSGLYLIRLRSEDYQMSTPLFVLQ